MFRILLPALLSGALLLPAAAEDAPVKAADDRIVTGSVGTRTMTRDQEMPTAKEAIDFYQRSNIIDGDLLAAQLTDPTLKLAAEWAAIRSAQETLGTVRIKRFIRANPEFPMVGFMRRRLENAMFVERTPAADAYDFFAGHGPEMASGKLLLAIHLREQGFSALADRQIRSAWRENEVSRDVEAKILEEFPNALSKADHFYRAQKLVYAGQTGIGLRAAQRVSADHAALLEQLAIALRSKGSLQRQIDAVPPAMRKHSAFALMRATELRRKIRHVEAAAVMLGASTDPEKIVDGDAWWSEERLLTRGLLDAGQPRLAYQVAAHSRAMGPFAKAEAEFMAGFVALRFLKQPATADMHFLRSRKAGEDAASIARAEYWLGQARRTLGVDPAPNLRAAAERGTAYYGQIAAAELGIAPKIGHAEASESLRRAVMNWPEMKVIDALLEMDEVALATPLLLDLAATLDDPAELDVVGDLIERADKLRVLVTFGKRAIGRGLALSATAFPTSGIPAFAPAEGSAALPLVFAVARQESAFDARAVSHADARGLMQMLPSTARITARRFAIPFAPSDLLDNPALNAKLGAAHLGELSEMTRGSIPLMLAAYNAGPRRMRQWMEAYGDPRDPSVDPIEWVERIPFAETRNYIQKVTENLQVYRALLTPHDRRSIMEDLAAGRRPFTQVSIP
jgi:soluble lytic murein transglycosylase